MRISAEELRRLFAELVALALNQLGLPETWSSVDRLIIEPARQPRPSIRARSMGLPAGTLSEMIWVRPPDNAWRACCHRYRKPGGVATLPDPKYLQFPGGVEYRPQQS